MFRYCLLALIVASILVAPDPADAQQARRVGVIVTFSVGIDEGEVDKTIARLAAALHAEVGVDVISGADARRRLPPAGLPEDCVGDASCRNDLGRRLDADELLLFVVVKVADDVQLDSTWADIASGRVTSRPRVVLARGADIDAVLAKAAPTLLPHIKKAAPVEPKIVVIQQDGQAPPSTRRMTPLSWTFLGLGAASLAASGGFALSTRRKHEAFERDMCREQVCPPELAESGRRHALAADVFLGVGVVSLGTAALLYLISEPESSGLGVGATRESTVVTFSGAF